MSDIVVTVPRARWAGWAAVPAPRRFSLGWFPLSRVDAGRCRVYVVACGRVQGWCPLLDVDRGPDGTALVLGAFTEGDPTAGRAVKGFQGARRAWWRSQTAQAGVDA